MNIEEQRDALLVLIDANEARIEELETALREWTIAGNLAADRIEALEAALRKIAEWPPSSRVDDIIAAFIDAKLFARTALDKDAGK